MCRVVGSPIGCVVFLCEIEKKLRDLARKGLKVRTYCLCSPGVILCNECFASHVIDKEKSNQT